MADNSTKIDFVDPNGDGEPKQNQPPVVVGTKPGPVKRVLKAIASPFVWAGKTLVESPAAVGLGTAIGSALMYAVPKGIKYFASKKTGLGFIPAEEPKIRIKEEPPIPTPFNSDTTE